MFALDGVIEDTCILVVADSHMDSHEDDCTLNSERSIKITFPIVEEAPNSHD